MHRLKQSLEHRCSLDRVRKDRVRKLRNRIGKNAGAATRYSARPTARESSQQSKVASDRISLDRQPVHQSKECRRLTKEQEVIRERLDGGHCSPVLCQRGPDHRAVRQTLADKFARLGQNLVGLSQLRWWVIQIREC